MKKLLLLIHVMRKCGRAEKDTSASSAVGNSSSLLTIGIGLAAAVGMFFAGRYLAAHQDMMGSMESIFSTIMVLGCMISFFLSIPQVINQLYMSHDLDVLVTLPVTDMQIVAGKLASVSILPMLLCCVMVIPCGIGFGITAGGLGVMYWVAMILSAPLLAESMVALCGVVIILLMRAFRFIRSRNLISILSTMLVFVLTMAYMMLNNGQLDLSQAGQVFVTMSAALSGFTDLIPTIGMFTQAMGGAVVPLLLALAITVAVVVVLFIVARLFYFSAALGMQDALAGKGRLSDAQLRKSTRALGVRKALRRREIRTILRTPSMITNGYLYSIVVPLVIFIPIVVRVFDSIKDQLATAGMTLGLAEIRTMLQSMNLGWQVWCPALTLVMLLMCSIAVCMSVLSQGCVSREGKDYSVLKTLPVSMSTIVMVKRDVAMLFNGISGVGIPVLLVIVGAALQLVPVWLIAVALLEGTASLVFMVDLCCYFGVRKPNLNWEAEADACKNNMPGIFVFFGLLLLILGVMIAFDQFEFNEQVLMYAGAAFCALPVVLAAVFDALLRKAALSLPERY